MEVFGKVMSGILLFIIATLLGSFVFIQLWEWFVHPVFGWRLVTMAEAYGIMTFAGVFAKIKNSKPVKDEEKEFTFVGFMVVVLVKYLVLWGLGAIVHYWII